MEEKMKETTSGQAVDDIAEELSDVQMTEAAGAGPVGDEPGDEAAGNDGALFDGQEVDEQTAKASGEKRNREQVLIKHKEVQTVQEFAETLEKIAQKLKQEGKFTFVQGAEQVEVAPSDQVKVDVKYKVKGDKHEFEIEFEWSPALKKSGKMSIE
ncbi:amphi-Trp domain-containing protein [Ureibacillus terrenus]|nr:amphi-Trp domain-containing protein [Ureibacillus terrenus]MED3660956.1 amphi-Trp domain-containing protein [Ureibacillus terrenus]MED3764928.1 amphi-Trp domain-containing protein [Ureibacillus terrenus]